MAATMPPKVPKLFFGQPLNTMAGKPSNTKRTFSLIPINGKSIGSINNSTANAILFGTISTTISPSFINSPIPAFFALVI